MAKRQREQDHDGAATEKAELNIVFVDTNLGTHLVVLVCSSDTASDFKKKVALEHKHCFPAIGEIQVHSVKVKRRSNYYHLPDIMLIWSAFHGVKRNWFLSVDASNIPLCLSVRSSLEPGTSSGVKIDMTDVDDDYRGLISDENRNGTFRVALTDFAAKENEMIVKPTADKPVENTTDSHRGIYSEEHSMRTESPVKKKRKVRHTKDVCHNSGLEGGDAMSRPNGKDVKPNTTDSISKGRLVSEGTYLPSMAEKSNLGSLLDSQDLHGSDRMKEDNGCESVEDVHPLGVVSVTVPGSSAGMMDASGGGGDVHTPGKKRKRREAKTTAAKNHDRTDMEQIGKGERIKPSTDNMEEGKGLSLEHDHEVLMPSNSKAPGHDGPDLALKEASLSEDAKKSDASIGNSHELLDSDERKEDNALESKIDYKPGKDFPTVNSGGVCTNISNLSLSLMDAGGSTGDPSSDGKKRKKKKVHKTAKVQDTSDVEQISIGEMKKPHAETIRLEEKGASVEHNNEVILPADSKSPDHVDPDLALEEASIIRDADAVMEPEISSCIKKRKKKKRVKKSVSTNIENSGIKEIHNGIRGSLDLPSPSGDHTPKGTGKEESTRLNEGMDIEMRLLDASNHDAQEKVLDVNREEADLVESQAEQTLEALHVANKIMTEKTKSSPGVCNAAFPTAEIENTITESNQVGKDNENTDNKSRKATKKRNKQKHTATDVQENGIRGLLDLPSSSGYHTTEGTGNKESTRLTEGTDVQMRLLDAFNHDAVENVLDVNGKEADLIESQAKKTFEELSVRNKMMMEKTKSFPVVCHAAFPTAETENTIMEPNQACKDIENTDYKSRKATKKRKKQKHTTTDVQENLPVKDQQVGNEPLATKETSLAFADTELEGRHLDSSQVLSCKNEEKVGEDYELVLNTDGPKENTEKGSEGVNFKQFFVADQLQNQVDLTNKVRKATKLKRSSTKAKDNDLPSISISTELQKPLKSFENTKTDNNSYGEDTVKSVHEPVPETDGKEMSPNYFKGSSEAAQKEVKDSSPSEFCEKPHQKPNDTVAPSSFQIKNPSLVKSSSERSKALQKNRGKERRLLGQNVTNMMLMKTPKKKILLAKSGAIFQDNSGESSGDENGTMQSVDSTLSPSDSSSMSGDSAGESEVSQNSASNGSNVAKGKSMAKLGEDLTMDLILRSSKRFKKAKELASQSETQPIEFVPVAGKRGEISVPFL